MEKASPRTQHDCGEGYVDLLNHTSWSIHPLDQTARVHNKFVEKACPRTQHDCGEGIMILRLVHAQLGIKSGDCTLHVSGKVPTLVSECPGIDRYVTKAHQN